MTGNDKVFYDAFGFFVIRQALTQDEVLAIERDFDAVMEAGPIPDDVLEFSTAADGTRIFKIGTQWFIGRVENKIDKQPAFGALLEDERITGAVETLLGPGWYRTGNVANRYAGDTAWHPDLGWDPHFPKGKSDPAWPESGPMHYYEGLKVGVYLDPLTKDTGCLRVIPGSHRSPFHEELRSLHYQIAGRFEHLLTDDVPQFGLDVPDVPCYAIETQPGDVVFFSHQVWHATVGGRLGRRLISWDYKARPSCEHEWACAEEFMLDETMDGVRVGRR